MYYAEIDPFTKKSVKIARDLRNRKLQRAMMLFFKPENFSRSVRPLGRAGRTDLIGSSDDLIPANPPREAIEVLRKQANAVVRGDHYHTVANPAKGERPGQRALDKGYPSGPEVGEEADEERQEPRP